MEGKTIVVETDGTDYDAAHAAVLVEDVLEQLGLQFDYVEHSDDLTKATWVNVRPMEEETQEGKGGRGFGFGDGSLADE